MDTHSSPHCNCNCRTSSAAFLLTGLLLLSCGSRTTLDLRLGHVKTTREAQEIVEGYGPNGFTTASVIPEDGYVFVIIAIDASNRSATEISLESNKLSCPSGCEGQPILRLTEVRDQKQAYLGPPFHWAVKIPPGETRPLQLLVGTKVRQKSLTLRYGPGQTLDIPVQ
jgi:hypothetical protein